MGVAQVLGHLFGLHHAGAAPGERGFLAGLGAELAEFLDRVTQPVAFPLGALDFGAMGIGRGLRFAARLPKLFDLGGVGFERAKSVEQAAVGGGVDQSALVVLAVDLDQRGAKFLHHLHAHRLVVDEGARPPVGKLHAAQNELVLGRNIVGFQQSARRMLGCDLEHGGHLALLGPLADQGLVAAGAERQRKGIEQDRLAGAGLAGEHGEPVGEIDVEPVDQDDVADGQTGKHGPGESSGRTIIKDGNGRHKAGHGTVNRWCGPA